MYASRRVFMLHVAVMSSSWAALQGCATGASLDEKSPEGAAVGYVTDTAQADEARFPHHAGDQMCSNCRHFHGAAGDSMGGCDMSGKQVAARGWCSNWDRKTG